MRKFFNGKWLVIWIVLTVLALGGYLGLARWAAIVGDQTIKDTYESNIKYDITDVYPISELTPRIIHHYNIYLDENTSCTIRLPDGQVVTNKEIEQLLKESKGDKGNSNDKTY